MIIKVNDNSMIISINNIIGGTTGGPSSTWILATGVWNDSGVWDDNASWKDS